MQIWFLRPYVLTAFIHFLGELQNFLFRQDLQVYESVSMHEGVLPRTRKPVKGTLSISERNQMVICDDQVAQEDFKTFQRESNKFIFELNESLFIKMHKPALNRSIIPEELLLFETAILNKFTTSCLLCLLIL